MVNCNLLESIYRTKRVELLCQICNKKYVENPIIFRRKSQFRSSFDRLDKKNFLSHSNDIPVDISNIETKFKTPENKLVAEKAMKDILKQAKLDAYRDIKKLKVTISIEKVNFI